MPMRKMLLITQARQEEVTGESRITVCNTICALIDTATVHGADAKYAILNMNLHLRDEVSLRLPHHGSLESLD